MDVSQLRIGCLVLFLACDTPTPAASRVPMSVPDIRVSLPPGAVDQTPYSFVANEKDDRVPEELTFGQDELPAGVRDLDALVAYRLTELKGVSQGDIRLLDNVPSQFDSEPARMIRVEHAAAGASVQTACFLSIAPNGRYVQLVYMDPQRDADLAARLQRIAQSVRFGDAQAGPARNGFTRRSVGIGTLEVPSHLTPPSQYLFELPNDGGSIQMRVWWSGSERPVAALAAMIAEDSATADSIRPSAIETLSVEGGKAELTHYTLVKRRYGKFDEFAVWRARVQFASRTAVSVSIRRRNDARIAETNRAFVEFVRHVREQR